MHVRSAHRSLLAAVSTAALLAGAAPSLAAPVLEWSWTGGGVAPGATNVMSSPAIIDITGDGVPEVIFGSTASTGGGLVESGFLRVLNGASGAEVFTVTNPALAINTTVSVAAGDIDGDGRIDIVAGGASGNEVIVFNDDGSLKWRRSGLETNYWGAPAIADLDGDGQAEIVMGRQVLDSAGTVLWSGTGDRGNQGATGPLSIVSDIDLDGTPEIIAGRTVYNGVTGGIERTGGISDGYNAVANFDADPEAEVVLVSGGQVQLLDTNMAPIWTMALPGGGAGGAPTVADFDNDGQVEIGVAGASQYVVFETNGTVKWTRTVQDSSSNRTGSSVFDFEGDGAAEVVYSDELNFYIFDGTTGTTLFQTPLSSCTWHEYPLVADVDGDGAAEIIAVGNTNCGFGTQSGIYVFGDSDDAWVNTRPLWNQHSYHVTNINLDGSIPTDEAENWLTAGLNNFRLNEYAPGEDPDEMAEPAALSLIGLGLLGLSAIARRRRR